MAVADNDERRTELALDAREAPAERDLCVLAAGVDDESMRAIPPVPWLAETAGRESFEELLGERVGPALEGRGA